MQPQIERRSHAQRVPMDQGIVEVSFVEYGETAPADAVNIAEGGLSLRASILPENTPVNPSPWYAFRLWAEQEQDVRLVLDYTHARHRYFPKVSQDGKTWEALDSSRFSMPDKEDALLALRLSPDTLWLAAQAPASARQVGQWCARQRLHPAVQWDTIGRSRLGRALWMLDLYL